MGVEQGERAQDKSTRLSQNIVHMTCLSDHWRRANQELESGDCGGRDSDARVAEESMRIFLGDVLRVVHARRPLGLNVFHGPDHRDLVDHHGVAVRRTGGRLRRARRSGVYTLEWH